jgi:K+-sensing histidine kinase KdpD
MFHDVQTAASSIIRSAERLQASQLGRNDDEKFAALHPAAQTLVKASGLLELRLRTMPIVINPAAAAYGNRVPKPIYKIVDMLVRILQPVAQNKNVSMSLRGTSHRLVPIFESFDLLPLTLIENAIKYSARDSRIEVAVNEPDHGVSVGVTSLSPWISPDERQLIFERRYRGAGARALRPEGYGLGLSIAEAVANAHESRVLFSTDEGDDEIGGVRFSTNRFFFNLR